MPQKASMKDKSELDRSIDQGMDQFGRFLRKLLDLDCPGYLPDPLLYIDHPYRQSQPGYHSVLCP